MQTVQVLNDLSIESSRQRVSDDSLETLAVTAGSIREAIASWEDIPLTRRRNWASSVSTLDDVAGRIEGEMAIDPGGDRWTCRHLNAVLWRRPPAYHGLSDRRFGDAVSALRQVLIRLGRHADAGKGRNDLSPEWSALYDRLPTDDRRKGLVRFFRFLTLEKIAPDAVLPSAFDRFATWLCNENLVDDVPSLVRRTASNWTWARGRVDGWPDVDLRQPRMRDQFTTPLENFPAAFQEDVERFLDGLRGPQRGEVFRHPGVVYRGVEGRTSGGRWRSRAKSPRTLQTRREQIRAAAAALLHDGIPLESITGLRDLVSPSDRPAQILQFHLDRLKARRRGKPGIAAVGEDEPTSGYVAALAELLRIVAAHHVYLPDDDLEQIVDLLAAVRPENPGTMNADIARKLRALNDHDVLAMLLHLPAEWMRRLPELKLRPREEALAVQYAVALEVLLAVPLRRRNLVELHIDQNLTIDRRTGAVTALDIPATKTKTRRKPITWEFAPRVAAMIGVYIKKYKPLLADEGNRFLFPGIGDKHREIGSFANELSSRVEREIGVEFNLHLIRHMTAYRLIKRMPGAYELVSRILGHASTKTTVNYYCGLEMIFAVREASRLLELDRIEAQRPATRFDVARDRVRRSRRSRARNPSLMAREHADADT